MNKLINNLLKLKNNLAEDKFNLVVNMFLEDISLHKNLREDTEESLCEVLNQCFNVVKRLN